MKISIFSKMLLLFVGLLFYSSILFSQNNLVINPDMVYNLTGNNDPTDLFTQSGITDGFTAYKQPGGGALEIPIFPIILIVEFDDSSCSIDNISITGIDDSNGTVEISSGTPGNWTVLATLNISSTEDTYEAGGESTQFLKFEIDGINAQLERILIDGPSDCQFTIPSTDCLDPIVCNRTPMEDFIGVNNFVSYTTNAYEMGPFGSIREYVPLYAVENNDFSTTYDGYPNNQYTYSPAGPYDYDQYFRNLKNIGKDVLGSMKCSAPYMLTFDYSGPNANIFNSGLADFGNPEFYKLMERKPVRNPIDPNNPAFSTPDEYAVQADRLYQFAARYGNGGVPDNFGKFANTDLNQGTVGYIENWNEQDKDFIMPNGQDIDTEIERRLAYFTPLEYAAMSIADGDGGGLVDPNLGYPLGSNNADPDMKRIMSGMAYLDLVYLRGIYMAFWDLTGDPLYFPFDAINLHHYSTMNNFGGGLMPEADLDPSGGASYDNFKEIISFRNERLNKTELWLTEFGYSDNPGDGTGAVPQGYSTSDYEEVQGQWTVRSFLMHNRIGLTRSFHYRLIDDCNAATTGNFCHAGLMKPFGDDFEKKKGWYYVYTLKNVLQGTKYAEASNLTFNNTPVNVDRYEGSEKTVYTVWLPSEENNSIDGFNQINIGAGNSATVVEMQEGLIEGFIRPNQVIADDNGNIVLDGISERPIFLIVGRYAPSTCDCNETDLVLSDGSVGAENMIDVADNDEVIANGELVCGYGPEMQNFWGVGTETATFDLCDTREIFGIYINQPTDNFLTGNKGVLVELLDVDNNVVETYEFTADQPAFGFASGVPNHVWIRFEDIRLDAAKIRVTKEQNAILGQLVICANPSNTILESAIEITSTCTSAEIDTDLHCDMTDYEYNISFSFNEDLSDEITVSTDVLPAIIPEDIPDLEDTPIPGVTYYIEVESRMDYNISTSDIISFEFAAEGDDCLDYDPQLGLGFYYPGCSAIQFKVFNEPVLYNTIQLWYVPATEGTFVAGEHPEATHPNAQTVVKQFETEQIIFQNTSYKAVTINGLTSNTFYNFAYRMLDNEGRSSPLYIMPNPTATLYCFPNRPIELGALVENCREIGVWWSMIYQQVGGYYEVIESKSTSLLDRLELDNLPKTTINNSGLEKYEYLFEEQEEAVKYIFIRYVDERGIKTDWIVWEVNQNPCEQLEVRSSNGSYLGNIPIFTDGVQLYPNPTRDLLYLEFEDDRYQSYQISDAMGRLRAEGKVNHLEEEMKLDISDLPGGIYMIQLQGEGFRAKSFKFVVSE